MYKEKYHVLYCDRSGREYRLGIQEWDYTGESVRHKAAPVPFTVYEETTSELKIGGIFPSRAELRLLSSKTFNMEELYTADERKYYVTHEPTDGSDYGKWYGFIIPNGFSEEMDNDVHYMILTASDNLGVLNNVPFLDPETGDNYGYATGDYWKSFIWAAKEALRKTGVVLPIWTLVDVKPMIPSQSVIVRKNVRFFENVIGTNGAIDFDDTGESDILQVGSTITVEGSYNNDGNILTVVSWQVVPVGFPTTYRLQIEVSGDITQDPIAQSVQITITPPVDIPDISDPLDITVHNVNTYVTDHVDDVEGVTYVEVSKNAMSTFDVLNNIAKIWNAKIHQNNGRWEIVRWNAYRHLRADYQYFVYNAEGTYIGRAPFNEQVFYPCKGNRVRDRFRPFGHEIYMDRVLKRVSVNYLYKYKLDGDSLVNLIRNGNFESYVGIGTPAPPGSPIAFTPWQWERRNQSTGAIPGIMLIQQQLSPNPSVEFPPGIFSFIQIGGIYNDRTWLTSYSGYPTPVNAGDKLRISWWHRLPASQSSLGVIAPAPIVIRIIVLHPTDVNKWYMLVNDIKSDDGSNSIEDTSKWVEFDQANIYNYITSRASGPVSDGYYPWTQVAIDTPPVPIDGNVIFEVVGVGKSTPISSEPYESINAFKFYARKITGQAPNYSLVMAPETRRFVNRQFQISGVFIGKIVDPNNESVPTLHGYYYEQPGHYTDTIPDIEILNGDDNQDDLVSNIYVMDQGQRVHVRTWNTWLEEFDWSSLGMLLAKSVMQLYYRPMRLIDGQFVAPNLSWDSRVSFEERPGELYAPLRGGIDYRQNRFDGTLVQVYDDNISPLPPGGVDAGDDVTPNWQPTENNRCVRDDSGSNTGEVEVMEVDSNPASQTFGQTRWVVIGEDTDSCPIGAPIDLLWGSQEVLDANALSYFPVTKSGDEYTVNYSNDGGPGYLRLLHRSALGTVKSITYQGGYESISGWVYEADLMVNGYLYKHMRLSWLTGVYDGLPVTFKIN